MSVVKMTPGLVKDIVKSAREGLRDDWEWRDDVVSAAIESLADENDRLRAERDEAVKLLERSEDYVAVGYCENIQNETPDEPSDECSNDPTCWEHLTRALLKKLMTP